MEFIVENYLIIILVGLFFVFALIGYLIDLARKTNVIEKEDMPAIKPVEIADINKVEDNIIKEIEENKDTIDADELLKNYDESINE